MMGTESLGSLSTKKSPRGSKFPFHLRAEVMFLSRIFPLAKGYLSSLLGLCPRMLPCFASPTCLLPREGILFM